MVRAQLKSRPTLITVAAIGLLLAYVSDFLALTKHESSMFGLIGNVLFFGALLAALPSSERSAEAHYSDKHRMTGSPLHRRRLSAAGNSLYPHASLGTWTAGNRCLLHDVLLLVVAKFAMDYLDDSTDLSNRIAPYQMERVCSLCPHPALDLAFDWCALDRYLPGSVSAHRQAGARTGSVELN